MNILLNIYTCIKKNYAIHFCCLFLKSSKAFNVFLIGPGHLMKIILKKLKQKV